MNKRRIGNRILAVLLCVLLLLPLCGCTGRELYERLLIHGIGVDVQDDGFLVTVRSSTSAEDEGEELFTCSGRSVLEALNSLARSTGRQPFYAHNYLVVFGKRCAEQGLDQCLDFFVRYYNTRPAVRVYLAEEQAEDVLSFQKDGKFLRMAELQQLSDSSRETGNTVGVELLELLNAVKRPGCAPVLPVLRVEEQGVEVVSAAFLNGYRLESFLTLPETRGFLAVKNQLKRGEAVVFGDFGGATLSLRGAKGKVSVSEENGLPAFALNVQVKGDVSAISGGKDRLQHEEYAEIETALSQTLQKEIQGAVEKAVLEHGCDIFGFGAMIYRSDPRRWEALEPDWQETMKRCRYTVNVQSTVAHLEE